MLRTQSCFWTQLLRKSGEQDKNVSSIIPHFPIFPLIFPQSFLILFLILIFMYPGRPSLCHRVVIAILGTSQTAIGLQLNLGTLGNCCRCPMPLPVCTRVYQTIFLSLVHNHLILFSKSTVIALPLQNPNSSSEPGT